MTGPVHGGAEVIVASRAKTALAFAASLAFAGIGVAMVREDGGAKGRLVLLFFGTAVAIFGWCLVRPQRLLLDGDGFELSGGLMRRPHRTAWRDVARFFVFRLSRGSEMVGFDYVPAARPRTVLLKASRFVGAEGALPKLWRGPAAAPAARLEAWRQAASSSRT